MLELDSILANATGAINHQYFHLPISGGEAIFRERVYCYELYHQMRMRWPQGSKYTLNGELAKSGHPILSELGVTQIPDFLVHIPGDMEGNHAIIEVKSARAQANGIQKDLETLKSFISRVGYERAIYLFYGDFNEQKVVEEALKIGGIELWVHKSPNHCAQRLL